MNTTPTPNTVSTADILKTAEWLDDQSRYPDNVDGAVSLLVAAQLLRELAALKSQQAVCLTVDEIEWLHYAVAHFEDDSEPEDITAAQVFQALINRIPKGPQP